MATINFNISEYINKDLPKYGEVWINYAKTSLEGFITEKWQLLNKSEILDGLLEFDYEIPEPDFDEVTGDMLNQYLFVKYRLYSAVKRSVFSHTESKILPPNVPTNLTGRFNSVYGQMGGDYIVEINWNNNSGNDTDVEVWGKWGNGGWQLLGTSVQSYGYAGFNHNIGMNPTGTYQYRVRAVNDSGYSEFSNTIIANTLPPAAPSNVSGSYNSSTHNLSINWTNHDSYKSIEIWRKINSGSYSLYTTVSGTSTGYSYNVGSPSSSNTYYFKVRGVK